MVHILIMFQTLRSAIQENLVTFLWKMEPEYQSLSLEIFGMARTSSSATKLIYCKMAQGQCIMKYGFFISPTYDGQVDQAQFLLVIQSAVSPERIVTRKRRTQVRNYWSSLGSTSYTLRAMPEEHINNYAQATASNLFEFFFLYYQKNNIYVSVQRVVCCSHQSDGLGYVSRTNQIAALGYVSRTNQSVVSVLWFERCSNFNEAMGDSEWAVRKIIF